MINFEIGRVPDDATSYSVVKPGMAGLAGHKHAMPCKSGARTCPSRLLTARRGAHSLLLQSSI